jgi:hypothetical protein
MPLTMRPTGLGHGVYKDDIDFGVFSGEWLIGRIYERRGFPDDVRWSWSLYGVVLTRPPSIHTRWGRADPCVTLQVLSDGSFIASSVRR